MSIIPDLISITSDSLAVRNVFELYKSIHQFPELSFKEYKTAKKIEALLHSWGIPSQRCTDTGVIVTISSGTGPTVAFRADIDALPILENTDVDFQSRVTAEFSVGDSLQKVPVMHACGHDVHIASALGAIWYLHNHKDMWKGTVEFIFQPAEELGSGAQKMVDEGLWDMLAKPEIVFGQHITPFLINSVALNDGPLLAQADSVLVKVKGKGAHASSPQEGIDPIVLAAHMIVRLQTIVSREIAPLDNVVITVGTIHGGTKENIISDFVEFTINVRTYGSQFKDKVFPAIQRILNAEADASDAPHPDITLLLTFQSVSNDVQNSRILIGEFEKIFGENNTVTGTKVMASEDFAVLADAIDVPYVFWFFGAYTQQFATQKFDAGLTLPSNHQPEFIPNSPLDAIATGVKAALGALLSSLLSV